MDKYDLYELLSGAQALFDDWNGVTGALHEGTSWHSELREGVIEDIVAYVYGKTLLLSRYAQPSEKPLPLTCEGCLYFDDDMEHAFALCRDCKRSVQVYDFYRSKPKEEV